MLEVTRKRKFVEPPRMVKMNVLLLPGQKLTLLSNGYAGKKGRAKCRAAARQFYQDTGMKTVVYRRGGNSAPVRYFYTTGDASPNRGVIVTRYGGALNCPVEDEKLVG